MSTTATPVRLPAYTRLVVPLDGTHFAELALPAAAELAKLFGASIHFAAFGLEGTDDAVMTRKLDERADQYDAHLWVGINWNVPEAIGEIIDQPGPALVCMASHARHHAAAAFLGSVAFDLLATRREPVVLVGPACLPWRAVADGPVVACVDGSPGSEGSIALAAGWADRLGVALEILTVAEPVPEPSTGHHTHRHHGPDDNVEAYLERLAAPWRDGRPVITTALYDAVNVARAVAHHLIHGTAGLVVVTSRLRNGPLRAVLGSTANEIVRHSVVPVVVAARSEVEQ